MCYIGSTEKEMKNGIVANPFVGDLGCKGSSRGLSQGSVAQPDLFVTNPVQRKGRPRPAGRF